MSSPTPCPDPRPRRHKEPTPPRRGTPRPTCLARLGGTSGEVFTSDPRGAEREGFMLQHPPIGPLRRFWGLETQFIIRGTALVAHLRKRINAQRLASATCKAGALPLSYGPKHYHI